MSRVCFCELKHGHTCQDSQRAGISICLAALVHAGSNGERRQFPYVYSSRIVPIKSSEHTIVVSDWPFISPSPERSGMARQCCFVIFDVL